MEQYSCFNFNGGGEELERRPGKEKNGPFQGGVLGKGKRAKAEVRKYGIKSSLRGEGVMERKQCSFLLSVKGLGGGSDYEERTGRGTWMTQKSRADSRLSKRQKGGKDGATRLFTSWLSRYGKKRNGKKKRSVSYKLQVKGDRKEGEKPKKARTKQRPHAVSIQEKREETIRALIKDNKAKREEQ